MSKFDFFFGVVLGQLVLSHSDNLSKSLQKKTCSAAEGQEITQMVIKPLKVFEWSDHLICFGQS